MKKLGVMLAALAMVAAACGSRGDDASTAASGKPDAPEETAAAAGDWGDLAAVCGPNEGGGAVPDADAQGVSEDTIKIGTVADPGFAAKPGLNQELFDAGEAFVEWCNAAGGINGKKIELTLHDAKLTDYQPVIEQACKKDFALVGGGAIQDNLWPDVGAKCDLIDVAGFAVTADKAGVAGQKPSEVRTVQSVPNPSDRYPVGPALMLAEEYPDAGKRMSIVYGDFQTMIDQKDKEVRAFEAIGHEVVHTAPYNLMGEANWKPLATAVENADVSFYKFIGEPLVVGSLDQAFQQIGYVPDVRLFETNLYDPSYPESAGPAADGAFVGTAYVPLEEAADHPATQLYIDNMESHGGKTAVLGLQSTSAWLLFATLAKECDLNDDLTRSCILDGAEDVTEWTGGGLHAPTSPATNEGSTCWMVMQIEDGEFTRWGPTDETFACDPSYQVDVSK